MCGTCKMSERMLDITKYPLKYELHPNIVSVTYMSVPVLIVMNKDIEIDRIYAFQSVPYLLEKLK